MNKMLSHCHIHPVSEWTKSVALHAARILFATTIFGLSALLFQFVSSNLLLFSMGLSVFTIAVCIGFIVIISAYPGIGFEQTDLGVHIFMTIVWLIDLILMGILGWYWPAWDTKTKVWLARLLVGASESLLCLIKTGYLTFDMIDRHRAFAVEEPVLLPRIRTTGRFDIPPSPQPVEPWIFSPLEAPRSGPQPLLPESDNKYDDDALELPTRFELPQEASTSSPARHISELRPKQGINPAPGLGRRGTVIDQEVVEPRCVSPNKQPIAK